MFLTQNLEQTINIIKEHNYTPIEIERYYIPKKNNLARPISLLYFIDLLVYQALCNIIEKYTIEKRSILFNNLTFANMPNKDGDDCFQFQNWRHQWKIFNKKIIDNYKQGNKFIAEYDIASFYDTIDHAILIEILRQYGIEDEILSFLKACLKKWVIVANSNNGFEKHCGIPQGPDCSGVIAELYLSYLDKKFLNFNSCKYFRYADDISMQFDFNNQFTSDNCSDYILNIFQLDRSDFIMNYMKETYKINKKDSKGFVNELKKDGAKYWEAIRALNDFTQKRSNFPDSALMNLDIFHNIILDLLLPNLNCDFGVKIEHLKEDYPCAYYIFNKIHNARNQETTAHYKDSKGNVRIPITQERLKILIENNQLRDAYVELFKKFS